MDDMSNADDDLDLGGERACWLDEVCVSCGGVQGHRPGCELAPPSAMPVGRPDGRYESGSVRKDQPPATSVSP